MLIFKFKKWQIALFAAILILGGISFWYLQTDSPEAQVRRTLKNLCTIATKTPGESAVLAGLKVSRVSALFAPVCRLEFGHDLFTGDYTDAELSANLARFRARFTVVKVSIRDLEVTIETPDRAVATFTGFLDGDLKSGEIISEVRDLSCSLTRDKEGWKIDRINIREILEK